MPFVVQAMQEFGRHEYFFAIVEAVYPCLVLRVMVRVDVLKIGPSVNDPAFLGIEFGE